VREKVKENFLLWNIPETAVEALDAPILAFDVAVWDSNSVDSESSQCDTGCVGTGIPSVCAGTAVI
jgi:hypothetical protein